MDFRRGLSILCGACFEDIHDHFLSEWQLARTVDGFVQSIRGIQVCSIVMQRHCVRKNKCNLNVRIFILQSENLNHTVRQVFLRAM